MRVLPLAAALTVVASLSPISEGSDYRLMRCDSRPGTDIKLVGDEAKGRNLYHFSRGRWVNVTRFVNPHHIFEYGLSPDGRYLFAWHMDFSPRRISVYDLRSGATPIGRFEPGFGGSFCWNAQNHIVHVFGCGSGCRGCRVYERQGRVLFELVGSPMDVSPSGRYLVTYPIAWVGEQEIVIYDLHNIGDSASLITSNPIQRLSSVGEVSKIDWHREERVTLHYVAADDVTAASPKQITLDLR